MCLASVLPVACSRGVPVAVADQAPPPPSPPPSPVVDLLDLVPPESSSALVIDVAAARGREHGPGIVAALLRLAALQGLAQALEIDLATDVDRILITGRTDPAVGAGDLRRLLVNRSVDNMEVVFELSPTSGQARGECREADLAEVALVPFEGPRPHGRVGRCGAFVMTSCCVEQPAQPARRSSAVGRALRRSPAPPDGASRVGAIVVGPDVLRRATCEEGEIELTGWHVAVADVGEGLTIRGWLHAATPQAAPALRACVLDGVAQVGASPVLSQLGVADLLAGVTVEQSPDDDKDVVVTAPLSAAQSSFLLLLLGMIDGSQAP
jgi:hypothetical protein